jgi:hypothetical protein
MGTSLVEGQSYARGLVAGVIAVTAEIELDEGHSLADFRGNAVQ